MVLRIVRLTYHPGDPMQYEAQPQTREAALALISSWIHDEPHVPADMASDPALAVDLALLAAAFLRCWAAETGIPPTTLLADIALGQALDRLKTSS